MLHIPRFPFQCRLVAELGQVRVLVQSRSRDVAEAKKEADRDRERMLTKLGSLEGEARILRNALEDSNNRVRSKKRVQGGGPYIGCLSPVMVILSVTTLCSCLILGRSSIAPGRS